MEGVTIADEGKCSALGASPVLDKDEERCGIQFKGWTIQAHQGKLPSEDKVQKWTNDMSRLAGGKSLQLPEMPYESYLSLRHQESGFTIRFGAEEALSCWARAQKDFDSQQAARVAFAKEWQASALSSKNAKAGEINAQEDYDWTYYTPWSGDVSFPPAPGTSTAQGPAEWSPADVSGIQTELLTDTSAPIVMFVDLPLYMDELHDFGDMSMGVKLRVMPTCWFILLRCWVRVDNVVVRSFENRIFHRFGDTFVHRDAQARLCDWAQLPSVGLSQDPKAHTETHINNTIRQLPRIPYAHRFSRMELKNANLEPSGLGELEALVAQVEFYFSDDNLPNDTFLLQQLHLSGNDTVPVAVIAKFNRVKKLLQTVTGDKLVYLAGVLKMSDKLTVDETELTVQRVGPLPDAVKEAMVSRTSDFDVLCSVNLRNIPANSSVESLTTMLESCGTVKSVMLDAATPSTASAVLSHPEEAFKACTDLTDRNTWRGGLNVSLTCGQPISTARKRFRKFAAKHSVALFTEKAKPPDGGGNQKQAADTKQQQQQQQQAQAEDSDREELDAASQPATVSPPLAGRQRGKVVMVKSNQFGFIRPLDLGENKGIGGEANLYFRTSAVQGKKKLSRGDVVEYEAFYNEKNAKWNAKDVVLQEAASAETEGTGENSGSNGEASDASTTASAFAFTATPPAPQRPQSLRARLLPKQYREARGPDGTMGFGMGRGKA